MYLRLFGSPELHTPSGVLPLPLERMSWLLALLAAKNDWLHREELSTLLWSDEDATGLQHRLRQLLYRLKKSGFADGIESQAGRLRWSGSSDLVEYKMALQRGEAEKALQLSQGLLLDGIQLQDSEFAAWLTLERESIANQRQELTLRLASQISPAEGLGWLEQLGTLDEMSVVLALRLAATSGQVARAEALVFRYERDLLELGESLPPELRQSLEKLRQDPVQVQTQAAPTNHIAPLPVALNPLLGREQELQTLRSMLEQQPLVSLVGIGGIGKTSLALEVVRGLDTQVVFVSLVGLQANAASFAPSISAALGLSFMSANSVDDDLYAALERRSAPLILVLDNVEHCLETARAFAQRFQMPHLTLLFTSRIRLGLRHEHVLELDGLSLPASEADLEQSGAGLAFLAAAKRQIAWRPNQAERQAILRLCHVLTGAPLALELAAAWLRAMSIFEIEQEISQSLDFLEGSLNDLPPRQEGLRATFAYSWRLLSLSEQRSLRRLSIFRGGFSQEAAIAITGIHHRDILGLSDKSLLRRSHGRLSLHELIREYASEKLRELETDWAEVAHAHAEYYLGFVDKHKSQLRSLEQVRVLPMLEQELGNIRAAMTWALAGHDQLLTMKFATGLTNFWIAKGLLREGASWLEASLQNHQIPSSELVVDAWIGLAQLQQMFGDLHVSVQNIGQAIVIATELGDTDLIAQARSVWARSLNRLGHFQEMHQVCLETMLLPMNQLTRAVAISWLATAKLMLGIDLPEAATYFEEALVVMRKTGSISGIALILSGLGLVALQRGDVAAARACLEEALEMTQKIGNRFAQTLHLINLGRIETQTGQLEVAQHYFLRSLQLCQDLAAYRDMAYSQIQLAHIATQFRQPQEAQLRYQQALKTARELLDQRLQLEVIAGLAILVQHTDPLLAVEYLGLALQHPQSNREIKALLEKTRITLERQLEPSSFAISAKRGLERGLEITVTMLLKQESMVARS